MSSKKNIEKKSSRINTDFRRFLRTLFLKSVLIRLIRVNPWFMFIFYILFFFSCSSQKLATQEIPIQRDGQVIAVVRAELAVTHEERVQGLMYRKSLGDGEGMLFIFEKDEVLSFWMRNTYIPLSIAYIAYDGRIIDIKDMYALDETPVRSSRSVRYALEVPQGWFSRAGVREGDIVIIRND